MYDDRHHEKIAFAPANKRNALASSDKFLSSSRLGFGAYILSGRQQRRRRRWHTYGRHHHKLSKYTQYIYKSCHGVNYNWKFVGIKYIMWEMIWGRKAQLLKKNIRETQQGRRI